MVGKRKKPADSNAVQRTSKTKLKGNCKARKTTGNVKRAMDGTWPGEQPCFACGIEHWMSDCLAWQEGARGGTGITKQKVVMLCLATYGLW